MRKAWPKGVAARQHKAPKRNERLSSIVRALRDSGMSLTAICAELEKLGHRAPRGGEWHAASVARLLA